MSISMTQPSMPSQLAQKLLQYIDSEQAVAFGIAVLFHLFVALLLLTHWQPTELPEPNVKTMKVQMFIQPVQSQPAPPVLQEPPPKPQQVVEPAKLAPTVSEAKFAKKRVEEEKKPVIENEVTETRPIEQAIPVDQTASPVDSTKLAEKSTSKESIENIAEIKTQAATNSAAASSSENNFDVSQYSPVSKEAPAYPQRALDKGVQGKCTVQYTVNTQGLVEDAQALGDCHALFIKPSLEATKTFRYSPRLVDGKAVKVPNVKNTFQYRIE
jgi:protein TonB